MRATDDSPAVRQSQRLRPLELPAGPVSPQGVLTAYALFDDPARPRASISGAYSHLTSARGRLRILPPPLRSTHRNAPSSPSTFSYDTRARLAVASLELSAVLRKGRRGKGEEKGAGQSRWVDSIPRAVLPSSESPSLVESRPPSRSRSRSCVYSPSRLVVRLHTDLVPTA